MNLIVTEQIDRAADDRLGRAVTVGIEEILTLGFGGPLAFNLQRFRHNRSIQKPGADRRVARWLRFAPICRCQLQRLNAVMMQQDKVTQKRGTNPSLAARAQVSGDLGRVISPLDIRV